MRICAAAVVLLLLGCSTDSEGGRPGAELTDVGEPSPEATVGDETAPAPGPQAVSIDVPGLPIGGDTVEFAAPSLECATVAWTAGEIPEGAEVVIHAFVVPEQFAVSSEPCGDQPPCLGGHRFTAGGSPCTQAVAWNGEQPADPEAAGLSAGSATVTCTDEGRCAEVLASIDTAGVQAIGLTVPRRLDGGVALTEESEPSAPQWSRVYAVATTFVAPATFLSALLFYFGYVSSRAQYAYFGVDVDTIGLSTQGYVMRSPQALLVPVLLITLLGAGLVVLARGLERHALSAETTGRVELVAGLVVLAGLGLLFGYPWIGDWPAYGMVAPLVLLVGLAALAWAWRRNGVRRAGTGLALLAAGVCVFWATATLAQWTGLGAAQRTARNLDDLPAVVVDTKERLYLTDGIAEETALPAEEGQEFAYRYRRLRLLIQSEDRMFLVPDTWTPSASTVLLPIDDVRVRFRFVNQPP